MSKKQNSITLKVRKGLSNNHNETALKVFTDHHNEGSVKEKWIMYLYANIRGGWMNHNETALKVQMDWPLSTNHNETALKVHKGLTQNHNETALKGRKGIQGNHNQTTLQVK
jgi:hypothetical protein